LKGVVFRSKVDAWVAALIYLSAAMVLGVMVLTFIKGPLTLALVLAPVLLAGGFYPVWLLRSTYYVVDDAALYVRSGPFKHVVPIDEIRSIKETRDPLASPAFSMDRLRITYGGRRTILISPEDKRAFLEILEQRRGDH